MIWRIIKCIPLIGFLIMSFFLYKGIYLEKETLTSALIGKPVPKFNLPSLDDKFIVKESYIKGPALLNVWATWCPSCYDEHTYLNTLARSGVVIYGINYKDDKKAALDWLKNMRNPYKLNISDVEGKLGIDLGVYGAPETFIIDAKGIIVYKHIGVLDHETWKQKLEPIYNELKNKGT